MNMASLLRRGLATRRWPQRIARNCVAEAGHPRSRGGGAMACDALAVHVAVRPVSAIAAADASTSKLLDVQLGVINGPAVWDMRPTGLRDSDGRPVSNRLMSSRGRGGEAPRMSDFDTAEEIIAAARHNLEALSDWDISAFWTELSKHLRRRNIRLLEGSRTQLDDILCHTLKVMQSKIDSFSPRDLSQTAVALARVMKIIEDREARQGGLQKGSPHQLLHSVFIGDQSQNKQFIMQELALAAMPMREEFDARSLSNVIYSFGLARYALQFDDGRTTFDVLAEEASSNLDSFNGQDFSNMLWAYANAKVPNPVLFKAAGDAIVGSVSLESFWPQALANITWAYATLEESHPKLFEKVADHIIAMDNLSSFKPHDLSNTVWASATLEESHPKLFKRVADHIDAIDSLEAFNGQDCSNTVWAYANAKESHPKLFKKIAEHIVGLGHLSLFNQQALSNTVWAYATAGESHPTLFKRVADHIVSLDNLGSFKPQALSNTVWAYATAKETHPALFKKVAEHIVSLDNLSAFKPQALSNIVWAYATAGESQPDLFKRVADHIVVIDSLSAFEPRALKDTVWAFATAGESHPALFQKVADAAIKRRSEFEAQGVANLLWAYASNGQLCQPLFEAFSPTAATFLGEFTEQGLANVAWAYAVADMHAPSLFNDAFINVCVEKEGGFPTEALHQLHQWNLWQEELKSNVRLPPTLAKKCRDAFISEEPRPSALQDDVVSLLSSIDLQPEEEFLTERGYRLDALVEMGGSKRGIEVDGPFHFVGRALNGSTLLKHRQVANLDDIPVISVPYWEWDTLGKAGKNREKKQQYLCSLLGLS